MPYNDTHIGAVGNHIAIAGASFTRPSDTNAYASGDLVANSVTAGSVVPMTFTAARDLDMTGMVRRARIKVNDNSAWNGATLRLHLYKGPAITCANGDNGAWSTTESAYLGDIDVTLSLAFSDPFAKGIGVPNQGSEISFSPAPGTTSIFGLLEARGAVTPGSGDQFTVELEIVQN